MKGNRALTVRQEQVLDCIREYIRERGYAPTLSEIGQRMGIHSTNGVNDHLRALEKKGRIVRDFKRARALRIIELIPEPTAPAETVAVSS